MEIDQAIRLCSHCDTKGHLEVVADVSEVESYEDKGMTWDYGPVYKLLRCPNCKGLTLLNGSYHSGMDDVPEYSQEYPQDHSVESGIPDEIANELEVLRKLSRLDINSFLVCCRRILEKVCSDLGAKKDTLYKMVDELEKNDKLSVTIKELAYCLRKVGNVGAHDSQKKVEELDLWKIQKSLFIVLDYFYIAPSLSKELITKYG